MPTCITPGNEQNVTTEMRYGPGGQLVELIAKNPVTGDQVTRYEYGVTLAESGVASNDLLRAEIYPDAADASDRVRYSYNRQGQRTRMSDQNGSVHEYEYDRLGRQTADEVVTLGSGVDGAVRRIGQSYEVRGLVEKITSYSDAAGTTPVNEVQNTYNSFAQLTEQYQEHSGGVDTDTTPKVEYAYADGSANTIRQTSMTYPNGRVLDYLYDDTHADKLSRVRTLRWDGMDVCRYSYLGLSTFVTTDYLQPQAKLDYAQGSGANPYTGFDRFGRIIDLLWKKYGASSSSSSSSSGGAGNDLVHLKYGYDKASNRTFREDLAAQTYGKDFDELYEYDGLHRLKKFHRGRLTDDNQVITSPVLQQGWQLDATGNWRNFTQNDQTDPNQTLDQQRLANRVNEITQIVRTVGANWATPEYDRNGNMTVIPQPKNMTATFQGIWDAWNRLVKLEEPNASGGLRTLAEYHYDGQTWRTVAKSYIDGILSQTRHFYFTSQWQDIEERLGITPGGAPANRQFVWGQRYIDNLLVRDSDTGGGTLAERLYALQDTNWNVTALADTNGDPVERYLYDAYGMPTVLTGVFGGRTETDYEWEYLFTGRRWDRETESYQFRTRYFATHIGGFLSRDLFGGADGENLYLAFNVPNEVDPSGEVGFRITPPPGEAALTTITAGPVTVADPNGHQWQVEAEGIYIYRFPAGFSTGGKGYSSGFRVTPTFIANEKAPKFCCKQIRLAAIATQVSNVMPSYISNVGGTQWQFLGLDMLVLGGGGVTRHDDIFNTLGPGWATQERAQPNPGQDSSIRDPNAPFSDPSIKRFFWFNAYLNLEASRFESRVHSPPGRNVPGLNVLYVVGAWCVAIPPATSNFISYLPIRVVQSPVPGSGFLALSVGVRTPTATNATFNVVYRDFLNNLRRGVSR